MKKQIKIKRFYYEECPICGYRKVATINNFNSDEVTFFIHDEPTCIKCGQLYDPKIVEISKQEDILPTM